MTLRWPASLGTATALVQLACIMHLHLASAADTAAVPPPSILVVGSLNIDIIIKVGRLPTSGETITAESPAAATAVGGKGANQAVAVARLSAIGAGRTRFICRFGNDSYAAALEAALVEEGVDVSGCKRVGLPSGQGVVLLQADGTATSIVLGGSNAAFEKVGSLHPKEPPDKARHRAAKSCLKSQVPCHH